MRAGLRIRVMTAADVPFALAQTQREGWDTTAGVFQIHLGHDPDGCFVGTVEGAPVGMVTTTRYRQSGWIGNLIVVPAQRHLGIGRQLMAHALAWLRSVGLGTIRLEADPPGVHLYKTLGFRDAFESCRFFRQADKVQSTPGCDSLTAADFDELALLDGDRFGDDRRGVLQRYVEVALAGYCLRQSGRLQGYVLVLPSASGARIGPWVAAGQEAAIALLESVLAEWSHVGLLAGTPACNHTAIGLLEAHGFERQQPCSRMVLGADEAKSDPAGVFAIGNGAMG